MLFSSPAILIRLTKLTETSLIVHWFTEEQGLVKTVAKGARRPASPFAGKLDLFFGAEISVAKTPRGDLHPLREVAVSAWREGLRRDYPSMLLAAYCCQLLELAVEPEHAEPALFDLLRRALDHLADKPPSLRALNHFEAELARLLGVLHGSLPAETCLRQAIGTLPANRRALMDLMPPTSG